MELNDTFLGGDKRSFEGARAASRDILPENCTIVLNIRDLRGAVRRRDNTGLHEEDVRPPMLDADEEVVAPRRGAATDRKCQLRVARGEKVGTILRIKVYDVV